MGARVGCDLPRQSAEGCGGKLDVLSTPRGAITPRAGARSFGTILPPQRLVCSRDMPLSMSAWQVTFAFVRSSSVPHAWSRGPVDRRIARSRAEKGIPTSSRERQRTSLPGSIKRQPGAGLGIAAGPARHHYPMCYATRRSIDAMRDLVIVRDLQTETICAIDARIGNSQQLMWRNRRRWKRSSASSFLWRPPWPCEDRHYDPSLQTPNRARRCSASCAMSVR